MRKLKNIFSAIAVVLFIVAMYIPYVIYATFRAMGDSEQFCEFMDDAANMILSLRRKIFFPKSISKEA